MTQILSLQRLDATGLDPCIWSGLSCSSCHSCSSDLSAAKSTVTTL